MNVGVLFYVVVLHGLSVFWVYSHTSVDLIIGLVYLSLSLVLYPNSLRNGFYSFLETLSTVCVKFFIIKVT